MESSATKENPLTMNPSSTGKFPRGTITSKEGKQCNRRETNKTNRTKKSSQTKKPLTNSERRAMPCCKVPRGSIAANVKKKNIQKRKSLESKESPKSTCSSSSSTKRSPSEKITLTSDEMQKLLPDKKVLALITLDKETEAVHLNHEAEQTAIIITDTPPSVPKLTRSKARKLKENISLCHPLKSLTERNGDEIVSLIKDELHSDEDDEEYIVQDDDLVSDDDAVLTASDQDSCPATPSLPHDLQLENDLLPKEQFSSDGVFKIPMDKQHSSTHDEDLQIASRTRSKLCLEQTSIEAIQSEFIPPDLEDNSQSTYCNTVSNDNYWTEFLNDFMLPFNTNVACDDDDPVNDPEYIAAAEKELLDAEELREAHIPKEELNDLMAELFEDLISNTLLLDSEELVESAGVTVDENNVCKENLHEIHQTQDNTTPQQMSDSVNIPENNSVNIPNYPANYCPEMNPIDGNNLNGNSTADYKEIPIVLPIDSGEATIVSGETVLPSVVKLPNEIITPSTEVIAVPVCGNTNCFQLVKVYPNVQLNALQQQQLQQAPNDPCQTIEEDKHAEIGPRYARPYDDNFTWEYISVDKHLLSEHIMKFEKLQHLPKTEKDAGIKGLAEEENYKCVDAYGFTSDQYQLYHQQLRIHVQMLTQTNLQTFFHPDLWQISVETKQLLKELQKMNLNVYNLQGALQLVEKWEKNLDEDTPENRAMMKFVHEEIELTSRNTRQISRFPALLMDFILDSNFFIYPQYLPRMPFKSKRSKVVVFAPSECYLIALGLEKHLEKIRNDAKVHHRTNRLLLACRKLSTDTIHGKHPISIYKYLKKKLEVNYYNPIKYYFDHKKAPPIEGTDIITFPLGDDAPPLKHRVMELPLVWQTYFQMKIIAQADKAKSTKRKTNKVLTFEKLVEEAVNEEEPIPSSNSEGVDSSPKSHNFWKSRKRRRRNITSELSKSSATETPLLVSVHYICDIREPSTKTAPPDNSNVNQNTKSPNSKLSVNPGGDVCLENSLNVAITDKNLGQEQKEHVSNDKSIKRSTVSSKSSVRRKSRIFKNNTKVKKPSKRLKAVKVDPPVIVEQNTLNSSAESVEVQKTPALEFNASPSKNNGRKSRPTSNKIKAKCQRLLNNYLEYLTKQRQLYQNSSSLVQNCYWHFKILELYTDLLEDLKMFCMNTTTAATTMTSSGSTTVTSSSGVVQGFKRNYRQLNNGSSAKGDEDEVNTRQARKMHRQEENCRHMLLPDTPEEANRKDSIFAYNFYEKVEETFRATNHPELCKRFHQILRSFNPQSDKVSTLYRNMEELFLPQYPELAEVFLSFLLPSDAAEVGKFFEHFMINNMTTFVNKLNIYFSKQPAQIRKIYNCFSELADDPNVDIKKLEMKVLPLLKGNQFLIEWFQQQFLQSTPPERLLSISEHIINLKECENKSGNQNCIETVDDVLDSSTSNKVPQQQLCQLRYIKGRIFYGSKMLLPAKLSFLAAKYHQSIDEVKDSEPVIPNGKEVMVSCVHGIRAYGERRLQSAAEVNEDFEKAEECNTKVLMADSTTIMEGDSNSSLEICDENALRSHAMRLNPSIYGTTATATTTTNQNAQNTVHITTTTSTVSSVVGLLPSSTITPSHSQSHSLTTNNSSKKAHQSTNAMEEGKTSPRKSSMNSAAGITIMAPSTISSNSSVPTLRTATALTYTTAATSTTREKRKSPSKKCSKISVITSSSSSSSCSSSSITVATSGSGDSSPLICMKRLRYQNEDKPKESETENVKVTNTVVAKQVEVAKAPSEDNESDTSMLRPKNNNGQTPSETKAITRESTNAEAAKDCASNSMENPLPWTRDEDKIILLEMKMGTHKCNDFYERLQMKLTQRTSDEIKERHQFLKDFLAKFQSKKA